MASSSSTAYKARAAHNMQGSYTRKQVHKSSEEFGFNNDINLAESAEEIPLAPADELFYKGRLLPLQWEHRLNPVQALTSSSTSPCPAEGAKLSVRTSRDHEEVKFNSCRMHALDTCELGEDEMSHNVLSSPLIDLRSSSFRSQHSGFWESGPDKDTTSPNSSLLDSDGSSQDSCFPAEDRHHAHASHAAKCHGKLIDFIPWKSLFRSKASRKPYSPISKVDLMCQYLKTENAVCTDPLPTDEATEVMLPTKRTRSTHSRSVQQRQAKVKSKSNLCDMISKESDMTVQDSVGKKLGINMGGSPSDVGDEKELERRKEKDAQLVRETWQGYVRKLKPLYEMKKGLMGQLRMEDCGKRAYCEVESDSIYISSTSFQRRLSHQSSTRLKSPMDANIQRRDVYHTGYGVPVPSNYGAGTLAMSSCPSSTMSSPTHGDGFLGINDTNQNANGRKSFPTKKDIHVNSVSVTNANMHCSMSNAFVSSKYSMSFSNLYDMHSAVQSAIAHCKESNKKPDF